MNSKTAGAHRFGEIASALGHPRGSLLVLCVARAQRHPQPKFRFDNTRLVVDSENSGILCPENAVLSLVGHFQNLFSGTFYVDHILVIFDEFQKVYTAAKRQVEAALCVDSAVGSVGLLEIVAKTIQQCLTIVR